MSEESKGEDMQSHLQELEDLMSKPGGKQAVRQIIKALSGFEHFFGVGSSVANVMDLIGEKEQGKFNKKVIEWASSSSEHQMELSRLIEQIKPENRTISSLAMLMGEVFGDEITNSFIEGVVPELLVVLSPATYMEMEPYAIEGLISIESTGSSATMGSGNVVGGCVEEKKRPHGLGATYTIRLRTIDS